MEALTFIRCLEKTQILDCCTLFLGLSKCYGLKCHSKYAEFFNINSQFIMS